MALTIGASGTASAHANFLRSDPAPNAHLDTSPTRVLVGFSEKVEVASSGLTLLDRDGREVASKSGPTSDPTELVLPSPALAAGVFAVAWHTVSAEDGHAAKGYFAFEVGPTRTATAPPLAQTKTQDGITVSLAVSPNVAGKNGYQVTTTRGGVALANVSRVRLRITPLDRDIGQSDIVLASSGGEQYAGSGFELPFAGRYRVQVQVRRSDILDDLAFDFELLVLATIASPSPSPSGGPPTSAPSTVPGATAPAAPELGPIALVLLVGGLAAAAALVAVVLIARRRT